MNILLISNIVSDDASPVTVEAFIASGILPPSDKPTRSDVVAFNAPLIAARVKGHDVYVQSEAHLLPSVRYAAKRVFLTAGEVVPGFHVGLVCLKAGEGEEAEALVLQKAREQLAYLRGE